jgi:hypothetical protein
VCLTWECRGAERLCSPFWTFGWRGGGAERLLPRLCRWIFLSYVVSPRSPKTTEFVCSCWFRISSVSSYSRKSGLTSLPARASLTIGWAAHLLTWVCPPAELRPSKLKPSLPSPTACAPGGRALTDEPRVERPSLPSPTPARQEAIKNNTHINQCILVFLRYLGDIWRNIKFSLISYVNFYYIFNNLIISEKVDGSSPSVDYQVVTRLWKSSPDAAGDTLEWSAQYARSWSTGNLA